MSEGKFSKCEGGGECLSVGFRVLEKKNEIRDFYLLGSNPLVGRHVVKHG